MSNFDRNLTLVRQHKIYDNAEYQAQFTRKLIKSSSLSRIMIAASFTAISQLYVHPEYFPIHCE